MSARRKRFSSFIDRLMAMMDVFDQTQALDSDEDATTIEPTTKKNDKKPVGTLKVLTQKGFPETSYPIRRGENVVGRSIDLCQIHIPTKVLSKRHAVIEVDGDSHFVYDAGSHNKSFKGSVCLKPDVRYELRDGETLKFADVLCRYYKTYIAPANDDDVTGSATESESIVDVPSTSSRPLNSSKKVKVVINEAQLEISHTSDSLLKGFELKSDSEVDDDDDKGDNVNSTVESVAVPDTPITPENSAKKVLPRRSCPHPCSPDVFLETDSDTDIGEDHSKLVEPLKTTAAVKFENPRTETDSSIDWENMQTQKFVEEESDHGMSKDHRAECDSNIDWENMQTQKFVIEEEEDHGMNKDLENMQTQVYVMEGTDHIMSNEDMLNAETQAKQHSRPSEKVTELEVATPVKEEVRDLKNLSNQFTSQSSDGEMRSVQATVAKVLKSKVLCESQTTSGVRDSAKADSVISNDGNEKTAVPISSSAITSKVDDSKMVATKKTARKSFSTKFDIDTPSTSGVQPTSPVTPKETSKSQEARPVNVSKLSSKKESSDFLPDPVALNVSLTSSPKTYSRMKRAKSESEEGELSSNVKAAAVTVSSEPKPAEETPTIRRKMKNTTGMASKVNEKEKETSLRVEGELKANNAAKDAVVGTSLEAKPSDKTPLNRRKVKETGAASKLSEKGDEFDDPSPQQRPTAPNLRISLGSSPTCKMLGPSKSDDVPAVPIDQQPSTSNSTRFKFKKLTSASKSAFAPMATSTQLIEGNDQDVPDTAIEEVEEKDQNPIVKKSRKKSKAELVDDNDDGDFKSPTSPLRRSSRKASSLTPTETEMEKPGSTKSKTPIKRKRQGADPTSDDETRDASSGSIQESEVGQAKSVEVVETPRQIRRIKNAANSSKASKDDADTFEYHSEDESPTPPSFKSKRKARNSPTAAVDKIEQSNSNSSAETKEKNKKKRKTSRTEVAEEDDDQKEQEVTSKKSRRRRSSVADKDDEQEEQVVASKKRRRGRPSAAEKDEEQEVQDATTKKDRRSRTAVAKKDDEQDEQEVTSKKGRHSCSAVAKKDEDDSAVEQQRDDDDEQEEQVTKSKKGRRARPAAATPKRKLSKKEDSPDDNVEPIGKKQRNNSELTTTAASPRTSPRKRAVQPVAAENDNDQNSNDESSEVRPKVMFTGLPCDAKLEKTITNLGGEIVDSVFDCTHLVTDKIRRTVKLLCALARGQPIVELKWLTHCKKAKSFIDSSPFIIADKPAEQQHGFVLSESLQKARQKGLLEEYSVHVTPSVMPEPNEMKLIIECARGKYLRVMPKKAKDGDRSTIVISCQKDISLCSTTIRKNIPVVTSEFILTGVLRQEVDVDTTTLVAR